MPLSVGKPSHSKVNIWMLSTFGCSPGRSPQRIPWGEGCSEQNVHRLRFQTNPLVWGPYESSALFRASSFSLFRVSWFNLKAVSLSQPARRTRCRAQELSRLAVAPASLQSTDGVRPRLDSCEHVSTLALAGTTITRGARFLRRDETRAASLYPVGRENPYP